MKPSKPKYEKLLADIGSAINRARENAVRTVDNFLSKTNTIIYALSKFIADVSNMEK